jgi:hypothetical protein
VVLLSQDRQREGAFTCTLLPSSIAFVFCTILNNITMKDYFSMLKSSVMLQCPAGLLIRVQPNTYIEKTEHFWTASHLVKERGWLNKGYNMQEVGKFSQALPAFTVLSLGYAKNYIGRTSLQTGPSSKNL